ncbi:MAG: hypothetical protein JW770_06650 [Actinobacteria bacterium]|nr:hypothetical protein [Actinomycetota bacterium]
MLKIVLISCVSQKLDHPAKAKDLYTSTLFRYNYRYAESLNPDKIFILSAKYGLLSPDDGIEPYNETLNTKSRNEIRKWAEKVLSDLKGKTDLKKDVFIFLAGKNYRMFLVKEIKNYEIPLKGLTIGRQLSFLKNAITKK